MSSSIKSCSFYVSGTHCRSCELLIEKEISHLPGIISVSASTKNKKVVIKYQKQQPSLTLLNKLFKDNQYVFSHDGTVSEVKINPFYSFLIAFGFIAIFYFLQKENFLSSFQISKSSFSPAFFIFGLLAGFSTCAALVGGLVLSLSRQWNRLSSSSDSLFHRLQPVLAFNLGRLFSFTVLGALLGYFGSFFQLSLTTGAVITILVSVLMLVLGLQMIGVKALDSFQLALPKSFTGKLVDETRFHGRFVPFILGGLTFFLPCGFTLTSQSLALASSNPIQGALIMFFFSLGTFLPLLLIGLGSVKFFSNQVSSKYFSQVAGILVIFFALFNFKSQLIVLGFFDTQKPLTVNSQSAVSLAPVVNGKYVLKMEASSTGYTPNTFKVKANQPIRWEITDRGTSGCTNAVISRSLFTGSIQLTPGIVSVKEFISPADPGIYRFSCWMGMISGTIEVI